MGLNNPSIHFVEYVILMWIPGISSDTESEKSEDDSHSLLDPGLDPDLGFFIEMYLICKCTTICPEQLAFGNVS